LRILLDTNRYSDLCRGDDDVRENVERSERVYLAFAVIAELRAGFAVGRRGRENERVLQRFLNKPGVEPLYPSDATTQLYATLYRQLRTQGTPVPTNDLWIAALAIEHHLTLYSRDDHFTFLPQLDLL
jgi:tRNA(fMet)-specific endonuclease VapC